MKTEENEDYLEMLQKCFDIWGIEVNMDRTIEEASEVIQAICKCKRFGGDKNLDHLHEEIVDLQICLDILYRSFLSKNILDKWSEIKTNRMADRIKKAHGTS